MSNLMLSKCDIFKLAKADNSLYEQPVLVNIDIPALCMQKVVQNYKK